MAAVTSILPSFLDPAAGVAAVPRPAADFVSRAAPGSTDLATPFGAVFADFVRPDPTVPDRAEDVVNRPEDEALSETPPPAVPLPLPVPLPPSAVPVAPPGNETFEHGTSGRLASLAPPPPASIDPAPVTPVANPAPAIVAQPPVLVVANAAPESRAVLPDADLPGPVSAAPIAPTVSGESGRAVDLTNATGPGALVPRAAPGGPDLPPVDSEPFPRLIKDLAAESSAPSPAALPPAAPVEFVARSVSVDWPPGQTVRLAESIADRAGAASANEPAEFVIRLDPPTLGRVEVKLTVSEGGLRAHLVVASDDVRHAVESQLPQLRERLDAAGVTVSGFDVRTDTAGRRPAPYAADEFAIPRRPGRAAAEAGGTVANRPEPGRLDVTA